MSRLDRPLREAMRLHRQGVLALQAGRSDVAIAQIGQAARLAPDVAAYHLDLGVALRQRGHLEEARAAFHVACLLDPADPAPLTAMADALVQLDRLPQAADAYRAAQRLAPHEPRSYHALGLVLDAMGQGLAATQMLRAAAILAPEAPAIRRDLSIALNNFALATTDAATAHAALDEAHRAAPDNLDIRNNLGVALRDLDRADEALSCFDSVIEAEPAHAPAHLNAASVLLMRGDFAHGWKEFEWRDRVPGAAPRRFEMPRWQGEALAGRTLLIHAEQGLGDTIQFCRFVPLLRDARVTLLVPAPLIRLLGDLPGVERVIGPAQPLDAYDLHCPLLSLPGLLGICMFDLPGRSPYLRADPQRVAAWRDRLSDVPALRVGICWAGSTLYAQDDRRSIPPKLLGRLATWPGVSLVSLQKQDPHAEVPPLPLAGEGRGEGLASLLDHTESLADFADTAALIETLDVVVSVDTAVAHLAGALGKPALLLDRFAGDWRWMRGRDDSPWYPTLRILRQTSPGDWDGVLTRLADQVASLRSDAELRA